MFFNEDRPDASILYPLQVSELESQRAIRFLGFVFGGEFLELFLCVQMGQRLGTQECNYN
jgi:hypothetical protein